MLTLPASFDEVARQLTIEAAKLAGLPRVLLVEEHRLLLLVVAPASIELGRHRIGGAIDSRLRYRRWYHRLYSYSRAGCGAIENHPTSRKSLQRLCTTWIVDVCRCIAWRLANISFSVAIILISRWPSWSSRKCPLGKSWSARSWDILRSTARNAKEQLLGAAPPKEYSVAVTTGGSRLIAGQTRVEMDVEATQLHLLDGFFPQVGIDARPTLHQSGFQEFGLPYASDAAITKHMAAFLWDHRRAGRTMMN